MPPNFIDEFAPMTVVVIGAVLITQINCRRLDDKKGFRYYDISPHVLCLIHGAVSFAYLIGL